MGSPCRGIEITGHGLPSRLIAWPGNGVRSAGLHIGGTPAGARASIHTHPDSGKCLLNWIGDGEVDCAGEWMPSHAYDV